MKKAIVVILALYFNQTNTWSFLNKGIRQVEKAAAATKRKAAEAAASAKKIATEAAAAANPLKVLSVPLRSTLNSKNPYRYCDNVQSKSRGSRLKKCPPEMFPTQSQIINYAGQNKGLVRIGQSIPTSEHDFVFGNNSHRKPNVQTAVTTFFHDIPNFMPATNLNIAFCGSGGGDRAMLSTLGFLLGAEKIGLLDMTTYMSALSGSTWMQAAWITSGKDLETIKATLKENLSLPSLKIKDGLHAIPPIKKKQEILRFIKNLATKAVFEQNVGPVDIWGGLIANHIFRGLVDPRISLRMTKTQIPRIKTNSSNSKSYPFPIYTAVSGDHDQGYRWWEFTPIECGSSELGSGYWCPMWAFGRNMDNGISKKWKTPTSPIKGTEYAPEQTLGFLLGICGSAFTVNIGEVIKLMQNDIDTELNKSKIKGLKKLTNAVLNNITKSSLGKTSIPPAKISNFTYGFNGEDGKPASPIKDQKEISIRDAGLAFNLPLLPLLRSKRKVDIIFVFDASGNMLTNPGNELKIAFQHKDLNSYYPQLNTFTNLGKETITVIKPINDNNLKPIIVYMPLYQDSNNLQYTGSAKSFDLATCLNKDCSTFNFTYSSEEFDGLTELTEQNIQLNKSTITNALKEASKIANKRDAANQ